MMTTTQQIRVAYKLRQDDPLSFRTFHCYDAVLQFVTSRDFHTVLVDTR